jgi:hypothetical protein
VAALLVQQPIRSLSAQLVIIVHKVLSAQLHAKSEHINLINKNHSQAIVLNAQPANFVIQGDSSHRVILVQLGGIAQQVQFLD